MCMFQWVGLMLFLYFIISDRDDEPGDDDELDEYINRRRQQGLQVDYDPVEVMPLTGNIAAGATGVRRALIDNVFTV